MNENTAIKTYLDLKEECAPVFYKEVEKFFAKGMLVLIGDQLDIISAALAFQEDDNETIEAWIESKQLIRVHDEHAKKWSQTNEPLMAIAAVPWVLVQEIPDSE